MTLEQLKALLDGVELRNFPYEVKIRTELRDESGDDGVCWMRFTLTGERQRRFLAIHYDQHIRDRDTGAASVVTMTHEVHEQSIRDFSGDTNDALDVFVRHRLYEMVMHEVCEAIHHEGRRVFDPHSPHRSFAPAPLIPVRSV